MLCLFEPWCFELCLFELFELFGLCVFKFCVGSGCASCFCVRVLGCSVGTDGGNSQPTGVPLGTNGAVGTSSAGSGEVFF